MSSRSPAEPRIDGWLRLLADLAMPEGLWIDELDMGGVSATAVVPEVVWSGRVLLFLLGAGWESGTAAAYRCLAGHFARRLRARVYLLHEDGLAAYRWLLGQGRAPASIALCGDADGASKLLSVLAAARDARLPLPAGGAVLSPSSPMLADVRGLPPILVCSGAHEVEPMRALRTVVAFLDEVLSPDRP